MISRPLLLAALALLSACGGGGGSGAPDPETGGVPTPPPPTTTTPDPSGPLTVTAGYGRVVLPGNQVTLSASVTEGEASTTTWRQTAGTPVTLNPTDSLTPSFTAPSPDASETLSFEVTARNADNTATDSVFVEIWIPSQGPSDSTLVGDYSDRTGWACDQDPVAAPELTTQDLGAATEYFTNGIPGHATGTFPNGGNPNTIQTVFQTWNVPNVPERTGTLTEMATFGVTLDGIKLERDTAESFRNEGEWRYEAITAGLARRQTDGARQTLPVEGSNLPIFNGHSGRSALFVLKLILELVRYFVERLPCSIGIAAPSGKHVHLLEFFQPFRFPLPLVVFNDKPLDPCRPEGGERAVFWFLRICDQ